jgi:energy-converting hydrogenase Eha subunit A
MTIAGKKVSILVAISALLSALAGAGGMITALAAEIGGQTPKIASWVLAAVGILSFILTTYVHEVTSSSG